jgi:hypothetical protein
MRNVPISLCDPLHSFTAPSLPTAPLEQNLLPYRPLWA